MLPDNWFYCTLFLLKNPPLDRSSLRGMKYMNLFEGDIVKTALRLIIGSPY